MSNKQVLFGQTVRINPDAPLFANHKARIAYIGTAGVSVYLTDCDFDECIPLKWDEFEVSKDE